MFESLEDMSNYINYGSYQFMSSVRVSYLVVRKERSPKAPAKQQALQAQSPSKEDGDLLPPGEQEQEDKTSMVGGGCEKNIDFEEEYLKAIEMPIDIIQNAAGKKQIKRSRKRVRFSNKRSRKQRK
jgi:hypothetical protein